MLAPERTGGSLADKRMVAREANNPPRRAVPSTPAEEAGAATTDGSQVSAAERPDTSPEVVTVGRNSKDRRIVGFGVFDPASTDCQFR